MARKSGIEALMHVVSAEWCLGSVMHGDGEVSSVTQLIPKTGTVTADQFVDLVFQVSSREARDPAPVWQRARAAIRAAFVQHMGGETVDAAALRWDVVDVLGRPMLPLPDPEAFARNLTDEELEEEMNAREDWRDRLIAKRELERRRRPAGWILWAAFYAAVILLLLELLFRPWFWA
jgi:hypothetical protein